ncbi:predicted protein [Plenodomus lingam JN3]|uniref:Uncharacterized protein n=1 Tax=Leptosphaeria maculans (strain JN3 / isolate v23.1.3 / race Av1-4-5-6-7-8) TaxID=985895 RepID=E5A6J3_LEPMJ|nr:predicted protein [Plenodomus lingam JN3]CBX99238.1 predicted protein [Plenodomus lingam JN3]
MILTYPSTPFDQAKSFCSQCRDPYGYDGSDCPNCTVSPPLPPTPSPSPIS